MIIDLKTVEHASSTVAQYNLVLKVDPENNVDEIVAVVKYRDVALVMATHLENVTHKEVTVTKCKGVKQ